MEGLAPRAVVWMRAPALTKSPGAASRACSASRAVPALPAQSAMAGGGTSKLRQSVGQDSCALSARRQREEKGGEDEGEDEGEEENKKAGRGKGRGIRRRHWELDRDRFFLPPRPIPYFGSRNPAYH